jgi:hypothetical protein
MNLIRQILMQITNTRSNRNLPISFGDETCKWQEDRRNFSVIRLGQEGIKYKLYSLGSHDIIFHFRQRDFVRSCSVFILILLVP